MEVKESSPDTPVGKGSKSFSRSTDSSTLDLTLGTSYQLPYPKVQSAHIYKQRRSRFTKLVSTTSYSFYLVTAIADLVQNYMFNCNY